MIVDSATGLVDCNWKTNATWEPAKDATGKYVYTSPGETQSHPLLSGVYYAVLARHDDVFSSVVFVLRNDSEATEIIVQTADASWQAYNYWGNKSLYYDKTIPPPQPGQEPPEYTRAYKVSYNRPFDQRPPVVVEELYTIMFLERNGYDVSYTTHVDVDRFYNEHGDAGGAGSLRQHEVYIVGGHDEYWSGEHVKALEAARANNVNMIFLSGNEAFWKTRWEPSLDASKTPYRTLVCYKQTQNNVDIDSSEIWTGLFRDRREMTTPFPGESANPYNHEWQVVQPENALTGTIFTVNYNGTNTPPYIDPVLVPANQAKLRLWRTSRIATVGGALDIPMGPEWDEDLDNGFRPAGLVRLSETTKEVVTYLQDVNNVFARNVDVDHPSTGENALPDYTGPQNATHSMTMYRGSRNGLVFSAGMSTWSHALVPAAWETTHPRHDFAVKQATVNLLADMGVSNPLSFEEPQQHKMHLASP
jgi:hypothetical protein